MNKRDTDILDALLVKLKAHFADPKRHGIAIGRGEIRAVIAVIDERNSLRPAVVETPEEKAPLL